LGHDISINEVIKDKKSWFNIKRFKIGNTDFQKPEKSLDSKAISQSVYEALPRTDDLKFSEFTKVIKNYSDMQGVYNQTDDYKIASYFGKKTWLGNVPNVVSLTLEFNPLKEVRKISHLSGFFDLYYQYSNLMLTVPNVRTIKGLGKKKTNIIDLKGYTEFVDGVYQILNTKNNKPIFVPISLRMSAAELVNLMEHYLKKQYHYYWIDFEGKPVNEEKLGRLRHLFRRLEEREYLDRSICYFTNVRREITSNAKLERSPASDVLCALAGANIVGVDREPPRYNPDGPSVPPPPPEHKARLLDVESYYYKKSRNQNMHPKERYVTHNALEISKELKRQSDEFMKHHALNTFLGKKDMLTQYRDGTILKDLLSRESHGSLADFL
jgi:hypothetical protein